MAVRTHLIGVLGGSPALHLALRAGDDVRSLGISSLFSKAPSAHPELRAG